MTVEEILSSAPSIVRDSVLALATLLSDVAVRDVKRELIQLCQSHPDCTAEQISLAVARSLHSNIPIAIEDSPPISAVKPSVFASGSEVAA